MYIKVDSGFRLIVVENEVYIGWGRCLRLYSWLVLVLVFVFSCEFRYFVFIYCGIK